MQSEMKPTWGIANRRLSTYGLLVIFSLVIIFHLLVLTGVVPFKIVWGGRLENHSQMVAFEIVSIALNLLMLMVVLVDGSIMKVNVKGKLLKISLWFMFGLFLLNTVGNLFSNNETERMIFTPLTLLLSLLSLHLAVTRK
jgi:hypothetical protein